MIFRPIERWSAGIRAPPRIKLQFGFFLVIGVLLLMGVSPPARRPRWTTGCVVGFVVFSVALALMLGIHLGSSMLEIPPSCTRSGRWTPRSSGSRRATS